MQPPLLAGCGALLLGVLHWGRFLRPQRHRLAVRRQAQDRRIGGLGIGDCRGQEGCWSVGARTRCWETGA